MSARAQGRGEREGEVEGRTRRGPPFSSRWRSIAFGGLIEEVRRAQRADSAREIRLGLKTLMLHKLRSMLTMLGVVFGVGSVIAMLAVGEGASRNALEQIRKLGSTNILVRSMQPAEEASSQRQRARVSMYGLTYQDHLRLEKTIPDVQRVVPVKVVRSRGNWAAR